MHGFPHEKRERETHGGSPGNGTTPAGLSRLPLASEGEATPGPDDYNPYVDGRRKLPSAELDDDPTEGDDPFAFDDVGDGLVMGLERFDTDDVFEEPLF